MNYSPVIGLEVHAQLLTESKLFCPCSTRFGAPPNANTCPVCRGLPGVLPVLNKKAVEFAIRLGLATESRISPRNVFARKNYFYPDLPKGYQISQYELPICTGGWITIETDGGKKRIDLTRIHMEEDAGKLLHEHPTTRATDASWVDLNRAGIPLLEIVSEPQLRSPQEAVAYLKKLRQLVVYLGICDGNMEEGSLRCDANISIQPTGQEGLGTKAELKNMNSFRHVERALEFEIGRQREVLEAGGRIVQETRLWDVEKGETSAMRSKEGAHDYRYFPDPDLLPLDLDEAWISRVRGELPELPQVKRGRFAREYRLPEADLDLLISGRAIADFFERCVSEYPEPKKVANWVINEFLRMIGDEGAIAGCSIQPRDVAVTLKMVDRGEISASVAKTVLAKVFEGGGRPEEIVGREGLTQVSDVGELEAAVEKAIAANPKEVARYRAGNEKLLSFFVGQVMKETHGKANPLVVNELLRKKLAKG